MDTPPSNPPSNATANPFKSHRKCVCASLGLLPSPLAKPPGRDFRNLVKDSFLLFRNIYLSVVQFRSLVWSLQPCPISHPRNVWSQIATSTSMIGKPFAKEKRTTHCSGCIRWTSSTPGTLICFIAMSAKIMLHNLNSHYKLLYATALVRTEGLPSSDLIVWNNDLLTRASLIETEHHLPYRCPKRTEYNKNTFIRSIPDSHVPQWRSGSIAPLAHPETVRCNSTA